VIFQFQDGGLLPVPVTGLLVVYRWSGEKAVEAQTFELNADASAAWTAPDSANFAWSVTIRVTTTSEQYSYGVDERCPKLVWADRSGRAH
jgi:hypothetical protein